MTRMPQLIAGLTLAVTGLCGACGAGDVSERPQDLPDEGPVSYTELPAHHPSPPPEATEEPASATERPMGNVYGPSAMGPAVSEAADDTPDATPPGQSCRMETDGCQGCATYDDCCDCYEIDAAYCDTLCDGLP
jgi:hypothetical protein